MRVVKAALAEVKGTLGLICILLTSAIVLSYILSPETLQGVYIIAGFAGLFMAGASQDILRINGRAYTFNKKVTYASPLLLVAGIGLILMNVLLDLPVGAVIATSVVVGFVVGWFSTIYNVYLRSLQDDKGLTVLDVMKDAQETLQKRGEHSPFCAIHPTALMPATDRPCSCGLEQSIQQLRAAIKVVSKS